MLVTLSGCAATPETVLLPMDTSGWSTGSRSFQAGVLVLEFVPTNESIDKWTRMVTLQSLQGERRSPHEFVKELESRMRARCPNVTWRTIKQDPVSVTYEWAFSKCPWYPDQHEVARLLRGRAAIHRVSFTQKGSHFDVDARDSWVATFDKASIVDSQVTVVAP